MVSQKMPRFLFLTLSLTSSLLLNSKAFACAVCYGDPNSPLTKGAFWGVMVLLIVITAVLFVFARFFLNLRKKELESLKTSVD